MDRLRRPAPQRNGDARFLRGRDGGDEIAITRDDDGVLNVVGGGVTDEIDGEKHVHALLLVVLSLPFPPLFQLPESDLPPIRTLDLIDEQPMRLHAADFLVVRRVRHPWRAVIEIAAHDVYRQVPPEGAE